MSKMPLYEQILTISLCILATMITRFLPFLVFSEKKPTPEYIRHLGRTLPSAVFGLLLVYCLKNISPASGSGGIPELLALSVTTLLHLLKKQMLLSIAGGTLCYMLLVQLVF